MELVIFNNTDEGIHYTTIHESDIVIAYYKNGKLAGFVMNGNSVEGFIIRTGTNDYWQKTIGSPKFDRLEQFLRYHSLEFDFKVIRA